VPTCARDMLNQVALELRCAHPWCCATGLSTSDARRLFSVVASREESQPFVLSTNPGCGRRQITFDANGALARALFDWLVNHERRGFDEERAM